MQSMHRKKGYFLLLRWHKNIGIFKFHVPPVLESTEKDVSVLEITPGLDPEQSQRGGSKSDYAFSHRRILGKPSQPTMYIIFSQT